MRPEGEPLELAIRRIVAEQFHVELVSVTRETRFAEDLSADSLDHVELLVALEDLPRRPVGDDLKFQTVGDLIDYFDDEEDGGAGVSARLKPPPSNDSGHAA